MRRLPPELVEILKTVPFSEIIEAVRAMKKKRGKGRPANPRKLEILAAAARVRAAGGHYSKLAARFKLTPKQLTDLVQDNRTYFNLKVREFRTTK